MERKERREKDIGDDIKEMEVEWPQKKEEKLKWTKKNTKRLRQHSLEAVYKIVTKL